MFFIFYRSLIIFLCLNIIFEYSSVAGLLKVDAYNVAIGSDTNYYTPTITRLLTSEDVANATLDTADLSAVLKGISLPLDNETLTETSWLNLPREKDGQSENLGQHLLRGHGPSGGISQSHIITYSIFSGANTHNGINMPVFNNTTQDDLVIDPTLLLTRGGVYGGSGAASQLDTKDMQKNVNSVNVPVRDTVIDILNTSHSYTVNFQVAPCRGMRKFILDLTQNNLVNTCGRPMIYDDAHVVTPTVQVAIPVEEAWLKKRYGAGKTCIFSCRRPRYLVVNLPNRNETQLTVLRPIIDNRRPIMPTEFTSHIPTLTSVDCFGREKQRIPMTIYYTDRV